MPGSVAAFAGVSPDTYEKIHHQSLTDIEVSGR